MNVLKKLFSIKKIRIVTESAKVIKHFGLINLWPSF